MIDLFGVNLLSTGVIVMPVYRKVLQHDTYRQLIISRHGIIL